MAGFLLAWTSDGRPCDPSRWLRAEQAALRHGGVAQRCMVAGASTLSWRRQAGEFAHSGRIATVGTRQVAWLGQCLDDAGDASQHAIAVVAADRFDDAAVARLNGPFAAAVLGDGLAGIRVVTDRFRHYPVYLYRGPRTNVVSSELRCLLPFVDRLRIDSASVDMLLRCGELIDRMTLLHGVELLPPATVLQTDPEGRLHERRWWVMRHDGLAGRSLQETADSLAAPLRRAVQRIEAATPKSVITLSGGLDSRIILDLCRRPEAVPSFTWGLPGCRDIVCATKFAGLVQSPHTVRHWDPDAFIALWARGAELTGGAFGIESMHMLPFVPLLAAHGDVVLNGLAGDALLGGNFLKREWLKASDLRSLGGAVWRWRVSAAEDRLVDGLTLPEAGAQPAAERWAESICRREGARPVERVNDWLYENRIFRYTNCGTQLLRSGLESHAPFFDRDFVDAVLQARPEHKLRHRLYLSVMQSVAPRAASVTWQRTKLPPAAGYHANVAAMAAHRLVGKLAPALGMDLLKDLRVADPAGWMRGPWREAIAKLLFNPDTEQRGLWRPEPARAMWAAHLAGADHTRQIGVMVAVELFARQCLEATSA